MRGLIQPKLPTTGHLDVASFPPACFGNLPTVNTLGLQLLDDFSQIIAHQIKLRARAVTAGWMDREFRGRNRENQPTVARIHRAELQNVLEERPIRIRILAVKKEVSSVDHALSLLRRVGRTASVSDRDGSIVGAKG